MIVQNVKWVNDIIDGETKVSVRATIDNQGMTVPLDPANRHYAAILEWVDAGNTIAEAD